MATRKIVHIDESKCDGCGLCVPSCAEGAIQIIGGKARLVSDVYCDGLGACLGECPQDAIRIVERDAEEFDEAAAHRHVTALKSRRPASPAAPVAANLSLPLFSQTQAPKPGGCPGKMVQSLQPRFATGRGPDAPAGAGEIPSALGNWPVQLHLVPPTAPYLQDADLLLVADCVPFAYADFHRRFLHGKPVVIGCPKLDDVQAYVEKLANMLTKSSIRSLTVVHMEVPCCTGLVRIAQAALQAAGANIPFDDVTISIRGEILERQAAGHA